MSVTPFFTVKRDIRIEDARSDESDIAVRSVVLNGVEAVEIREYMKDASVWGHGIVFEKSTLTDVIAALQEILNG